MWYNTPMKWLLRSPLHGVISKSFMLIRYNGRKSGKVYETPVNYTREGNEFTVISLRGRTWWRNLRGGAPVNLSVRGRELRATGQVVEDDGGVASNLSSYLNNNPGIAKYFQVSIDGAGRPNCDEIARAAQGRVVVKLKLTTANFA